MDEDMIVLLDEEGVEHDFTLLELLEGRADIAVHSMKDVPVEFPEEGVVVLRIEKANNGEDVYMVIEDDEEFERVRQALESLDEED